MGVFVAERADLVAHAPAIRLAVDARSKKTTRASKSKIESQRTRSTRRRAPMKTR
jgi:hypothetical protein